MVDILNPIAEIIKTIAGQGQQFTPDQGTGLPPYLMDPAKAPLTGDANATPATADPTTPTHDFTSLAMQALARANAPQKEQSWGDVGKGLIAPLAVGLLSSLVYPKYGGRAAGLGQGIQAGVGTWLQMQQQQAAARANAQKNAVATALALAKMGQSEQTGELKKATLAQTGELGKMRIEGMKEGIQQRREAAAMRYDEAQARLEELRQAAKQRSQDYRLSIAERAEASRQHNDLVKALAEMRMATAKDKPGKTAKAFNASTGLLEVVPEKALTDGSGDYIPYTANQEKRVEQIQAARGAMGQLNEAVNRPSIQNEKDQSAPMKWFNYYAKYKGMGGAGLSPDQQNLIQMIDQSRQLLAGLTTALSGNRSLAMIQMVQSHFPQQQDKLDTLIGKAKTISLGTDLALDAAGFKGDMIQDPAGLAKVKAMMKLNKDSSAAEYEKAAATIAANTERMVSVNGEKMTALEFQMKKAAGELPENADVQPLNFTIGK